MTWLKKVHVCEKPTPEQARLEDAGIGSLWQCPTCHRRWSLTMFGWLGLKEQP